MGKGSSPPPPAPRQGGARGLASVASQTFQPVCHGDAQQLNWSPRGARLPRGTFRLVTLAFRRTSPWLALPELPPLLARTFPGARGSDPRRAAPALPGPAAPRRAPLSPAPQPRPRVPPPALLASPDAPAPSRALSAWQRGAESRGAAGRCAENSRA